uniref:DUF834 domain-containing protein n=1 Tax=Oryza glumipatula TaxID=40148 RepID=A0A0E0ATV6_9ORYZ
MGKERGNVVELTSALILIATVPSAQASKIGRLSQANDAQGFSCQVRWEQDQGGDQTRSKFTQASLRPARGGAAWEAWDQREVARALGWLRPGREEEREKKKKEERRKTLRGKNIGIDNEKDGEK